MGVRLFSQVSDADLYWDESAGVLGSTVDVIRANSDGAASAQVDIGLVGPASEAAINIGGEKAYRTGAGVVRALVALI